MTAAMPHDATNAIVEIDLAAIAANYRHLADTVAPQTCAAVVKANAYGLGIDPVAITLHEAGCQHFFVATIGEGIALRALLTDVQIGVFYGVSTTADAALCAEHNLLPSLNSLEQIAVFCAAATQLGRLLPACVHVDTGMNRLGLSLADAEHLAANRELLHGIDVRWLMTHLSCAPFVDHTLNPKQLERFDTVQALFPEWPTSITNSPGIFLGQEYHGNLARPGAALYGLNPHPKQQNPMRNVVTIKAPVIQLRTVGEEQGVGYGCTYTAPAGARLASIACGYADGLLRSMSNKTQAYVAGQYVPVVGIVSMDVTVIDISGLPQGAVGLGDMVEFVGKHLSIDKVAAQAGTIGYEILTSLNPRIRRIYLR